MKKISFRVRNFSEEQFLTFNIDNNAELDEELLDFLEEEEPEGIVPVIFEEGEEFDTFSYDITDKIHLCELSDQEINAEMVLMVLRGLVISMMNMSEYRIPLSYLVLNRQYIYIDSDYKVEFVCIPLEDMKEEADLTNFFRNFVASLRFDPTENGDYVAKILTYVNNRELFNLHNLLTLIEQWMERLGIEIPEGNTNEIYGEYTEVDDSAVNDETVDEDISLNETAESDRDDEAFEPEETAAEAIDNEPQWETAINEAEEAMGDDNEEFDTDIDSYDDSSELADDVEAVDSTDIEESAGPEIQEEAEPEVMEEIEPEIQEEAEPEIQEETEPEIQEETEPEIQEESAEPEIGENVVSDIEKAADSEPGVTDGDNTDTESVDDTKIDNNEDDGHEDVEEDHAAKRSFFKTKDAATGAVGVVIEDDFDAFLAEKEKEEQNQLNDDSGLKIRKDIKINRASIVKNTQDELKAAEDEKAEDENDQNQEPEQQEKPEKPKSKRRNKKDKADKEKDKDNNKEDDENNDDKDEAKDAKEGGSIISQTIGNAASSIINATTSSVPKVNPYLIRVNTDERIMIKKQTFKIGKAGMGVDYTISGNGAISRVHAIITGKDGEYFIRDNKSTNHTFVDGKNVEEGENAPLTDGCKIVLGDEEFVFKLQ